ncbi:MAG: ATP-dependent Clp protease proteolytic subunit [Candidatus Aureabacteria bacterium]|nr:ATP-dependent Clp protease proteolytic subunit [Candidatus Auribacterota bacterium]
MNSSRIILPLIFLAALAAPCPGAARERDRPVYVIPVEGEIEEGLVWVIRRGITEAERNRARAIVLHIDTNGGSVAATQEILKLLARTKIPTYSFIDLNALSAGAYIATATNHIYMAPGSTIGAATPIAAIPGIGPVHLDQAVEEKMTSALRAMIASAAEKNGHPAKIVEAMVDRDVEIPGVVEKGKLLTLTNQQAESDQVGLSEGTAESLSALLETTGLSDAPLVTVETTPAEKAARVLTNSVVTIILLIGGLAGIYLEIKTPGFGLPGIAGILLLSLFFFGHYIAGLAGYEEIALFLAGAVLLFIELFVTPGFGLLGVSGIVLIVVSFVLAMGEGPFFSPETIFSPNYLRALTNLGISLLGLILLILLTYRSLFVRSSPFYGKFVLTAEEKGETGFVSAPRELSRLKGIMGSALSSLRPAGRARFGDEVADVVTQGEFIEAGTGVEVVAVEGSRIVVKKSGRE